VPRDRKALRNDCVQRPPPLRLPSSTLRPVFPETRTARLRSSAGAIDVRRLAHAARASTRSRLASLPFARRYADKATTRRALSSRCAGFARSAGKGTALDAQGASALAKAVPARAPTREPAQSHRVRDIEVRRG